MKVFEGHVSPDILNIESQIPSSELVIRDELREFLWKEVQPSVREGWRDEIFPRQLIRKLGALGVLGGQIGENPSLSPLAYGLVMMELERVDSGLRSLVSVQGALSMYAISAFGSEQQNVRWFPKLASGECVGCFGLSEDSGGSDPGAMRTKAVKQGDKWILNGSKTWITNGAFADVAVVWARTPEGIRGFAVPMKTPGVSTQVMVGKQSLRFSETAELFFSDVELDSEECLLPKTKGLGQALACLNQARYGIIWGVIGAAEACFQQALIWSKTRVLFGQPLASKQMIQIRLSEMATKVSQAKLLAKHLACLKSSRLIKPEQISMAKAANCQMALEVARDARDLMGAYGIMDEFPIMRHMCNLETVATYEGTRDIHRLVVGAHLTGETAF